MSKKIVSFEKQNDLVIPSLLKKKTMKGIVIGVILGTIITGGIGVTAITLSANQVNYSPSNSSFNVSNVKAAIDKLYEITEDVTNSAKPITFTDFYLQGSHTGAEPAVGEGNGSNSQSEFTLDVSNYTKLTISDFFIQDRGTWNPSSFTITGNDGTVIRSESYVTPNGTYSVETGVSMSTKNFTGGTYDISSYETIKFTFSSNTNCTDANRNYYSVVKIASVVIE